MPSSLLQVVNSLFQTCYNKLATSSANTTCWQLVNRFVTTCLQTCYKLCVFTRVCMIHEILRVKYTRKNAQVVTNLRQTCSNAVPTTCQQDVFALLVPSLLTSCQRLVENLLQSRWQLATRLLSSTDLLQVVQTTCYRPATHQFVNKLSVTTL
jgi:hypothetical protein